MVMRRIFRIVSGIRHVNPPSPADAPPPDRRRSPRLALFAHCDVYDPVRFQSRARAKLVNIGLQGIGLETTFLTARGDELVLNFTIGRQRIENARAVIMWSRQGQNRSFSGLQFHDRSLGNRVRRALIRQLKASET